MRFRGTYTRPRSGPGVRFGEDGVFHCATKKRLPGGGRRLIPFRHPFQKEMARPLCCSKE